MKIFACDSSAKSASVAVCDGRRLLAEYTVNNGNTHSETLLPMAEAALRSLGMTVDDVDLFGCSAGPGSFTGVRIGAATVKGLAFGKGKPCIGVSTLEALARNLVCDCDRIIYPVMDARRGQFYTAAFKCESGKLVRLTDDRALSSDELLRDIASRGKRVWLCGDGYDEARRLLPCELLHTTEERLIYQSAYNVALSVLESYEAGVRTTDAELHATYLRLPQAERDRLEKLADEKRKIQTERN